MMRFLFLIGALAFGTSLFSQAEFGWGLEIYPNFSNRRLIVQPSVSRDDVRALEALETARPSYTAGLFAQWRGDRAGFQTGLRFVNTGYRTIRANIAPEDNPPLGAEQKRNDYQNFFLEAPAEILFFHQLDDKNHFFFTIGLSLAYNLTNYETVIFYDGESRQPRRESIDKGDFVNLHYNFLSGMGWEHQFSDGFALVLQPTFQFWLKSLLQQAEVNRNLYSIGIRLGAKF